MLLLLALVACRCDSLAPPQDVSFAKHELQQVGGRFVDEPETPVDPQVAFAVQSRCPQITRATLRQANAQIRYVSVWGSGLDGVKRVGAALYDGTLANVHFDHDGDALVFPVACNRCEVYLGVQASDRTAACLGPGYSISIRDGQIVP